MFFFNSWVGIIAVIAKVAKQFTLLPSPLSDIIVSVVSMRVNNVQVLLILWFSLRVLAIRVLVAVSK